MSRSLAIWSLGLALLGGCQFDDRVTQPAKVACESDAQCPSGHVCDRALTRCVGRQRPLSVEPAVSPPRARAGTRVTARIEPRAPYQVAAVYALSPAGASLGTFQAADGLWTWTVAGDEPEGRALVVADLKAPAEVLLAISIGETVLDFRPAAVESARVLAITHANAAVLGEQVLELARLGPSASLSLELTVDEELAQPPTLLAPGVTFTREAATGRSFRFSGQVDPDGGPEGQVAALLEAEDLAGNRALAPVGLDFDIDRSPPAAPPVDVPGAVVYRRAPDSSARVDGGAPFYALRLAEPREPVLVLVWNQQTIVGRGYTRDAGGVPFINLRAVEDAPVVDVQLADLAGNLSPRVPVRDVERLVRLPQPALQVSEADGVAFAQASSGNLLAVDDAGVGVTSRWSWRTARGLQFSGETAATYLPDLSFHGPSFGVRSRFEVGPGNEYSRGACSPAGAAYAGTLSFSLLGLNYVGSPEDTPCYLFSSPGPAPEVRAYSTLTRVQRHAVLVGGGRADGGLLPVDAWRLSGVNWTRLADPPLPARQRHVAVYDSRRDQLVVFGGRGASGPLGDTWLMSADGGWRSLAASPAPSPRYGAAAAWEPVSGRCLVHGGTDGAQTFSDLWSFDGARWTLISASGPQRSGHALGFDPVTGKLILAGGDGPDSGSFPQRTPFILDLDAGWVPAPEELDTTLPESSWAGGNLDVAVGWRDNVAVAISSAACSAGSGVAVLEASATETRCVPQPQIPPGGRGTFAALAGELLWLGREGRPVNEAWRWTPGQLASTQSSGPTLARFAGATQDLASRTLMLGSFDGGALVVLSQDGAGRWSELSSTPISDRRAAALLALGGGELWVAGGESVSPRSARYLPGTGWTMLDAGFREPRGRSYGVADPFTDAGLAIDEFGAAWQPAGASWSQVSSQYAFSSYRLARFPWWRRNGDLVELDAQAPAVLVRDDLRPSVSIQLRTPALLPPGAVVTWVEAAAYGACSAPGGDGLEVSVFNGVSYLSSDDGTASPTLDAAPGWATSSSRTSASDDEGTVRAKARCRGGSTVAEPAWLWLDAAELVIRYRTP